MIGKVIKNHYRIMDEIGRGSVATVYLAKDTDRNQVVALKVIHPERAAEGQFLQRFQREARLLQMLSSPQAVKVLDYGEDDGLYFIALEYVQGRTLASILEEEGPLEVHRALDIAKQVALCLVDAHAKSTVHRDLRPANIMVAAEGTVKVMDFGIAWGADLSRLTATGALGNPHYLSPEQASGKEMDGRSDIYSLGVTLFEMLSGRRPYEADSAVDIVLAHLREPIPSLHQLDERVPPEVDELVQKCLAKRPENRYQSAAEFLEAVDETLRAVARRKEGVTMGMEAGLVGQTLGAYRIVEQIGRGGMATVYKAYEPALDRYVAIKILPQYFAHDPDFTARFEREAKAVAKLDHPNILPIYSFGQERGLSYIAMRYVEAGTLKEMLGQPLDLKVTADILGQIGRALDYAHQRGIVHRDVKPTNVLMAEGQWALLTDFGLARMVESSVQLTKSGVGVGTPAYMSPEQGQGLKVDARSDVYSLGVALYEMVTGRVPYEAETPMAIVLKHITAPLPLPREVNPDLPEGVERVILKAMAKAPEDRYQTAGEMVEALEKAVAGVPVVERPPEVKPLPVAEVPSAVAAEPTPAPAVAVPVETPPVARKGLPAWVWGVVGAVVLLIAASGVFFATRGEKPSPTPEATAALVATPIPPTPLKPISPGGPPIDAIGIKPCQWDGLGPGLCISPLGGGTTTRILEDTELEIPGPPSWSPDGRQIAFSALEPGESPDRDTSIYIVNADGSSLTELPSVGNDINPAWSPDGEWLAFHSSCSLAIMHPDGSSPTVIWNSEGRTCTFEPQWSPDSQWIVVFMQMEGDGDWTFPMTRELWVISRDGATVTPVATTTHGDDSCLRPDVAFSPDGRQVAYFDADCRPWLVNADGSGQAVPLTDFPGWWHSTVYPQWGVEKEVPLLKPVSPGSPPPDAREIEPCQWGNRGPGLCIYPSGDDTPTKILVDAELDMSGGGPPSWSPNGQQIAFSAIKPGERPDLDSKIYIVNADGSGLTELPAVGNDVRPAWSPDGEWLAFHSSGDLAIMRPDGSDPAVIWHSGEGGCTDQPQWSPDSQWIAVFTGKCEWTFPMTRKVRVISRDGATVNTVATITHENESCVWPDVAFSPDGLQIAYNDANCQPWMVNADGSGQAMPLEGFPFWWTSAVYPQWEKKEALPPKPVSPALPEKGKVVEWCEGPQPPQLCVRDAQTGRVTQVTDSLEFGGIGPCAWSPDGQQIIFGAGSDFRVTQRNDHKLYVINADGSNLRQITNGDVNDVFPAWSPDGQWIAFHRNCELWIIRPDGSDGQRLLERSDEFCAAVMVWSPDSQQIAFSNASGGPHREVWVISRDETAPHVVHSFERPLEGVDLAWNPDGRQIACFYEKGGEEKGLLINADGSGEKTVEKDMIRVLRSWLPNFWPQWGGEKQATPPPTSAPEAAPVPADPWGQVVVPPGDVVRIGLVADFSGEVSQLGPVKKDAAQMAIDDQGPVKGFPISVVEADGGCDEAMGAAAAQSMIADPAIVGVIGHTCSKSCAAGASLYEGAHLVMISPSCTGPGLSDPGYQVFNRVAIRDDQGGDERNVQAVNTDVYQDFARRYQDRYGQALDSAGVGFYAAYAYDATVILIKAIELASVVDEAGNLVIGRQALANAVRATPGHRGVTGVISFDDRGDRLP